MVFHLYSNFRRNFCKQTEENLIRHRILRRLIWFCTVCWCPTKRMLGWFGLTDAGTGASSTLVAPLPGTWLVAHIADLTPDLQVLLSWGSSVLSFHSRQSFSVNFFHVSLGPPGPRLLSTCISHTVLTVPQERATCPNQYSLSLKMRSRSSSSSFASSSLDLTVATSSGLTRQIKQEDVVVSSSYK